MQDRSDQNSSLVERGWDAMSTTLDKQMPVSKKRRTTNGIVFFLLLALVVSLGLWYFKTGGLNRESPVLENKAPFAKLEDRTPPVVALERKQDIEEYSVVEEKSRYYGHSPSAIETGDGNQEIPFSEINVETHFGESIRNDLASRTDERTAGTQMEEVEAMIPKPRPLTPGRSNGTSTSIFLETMGALPVAERRPDISAQIDKSKVKSKRVHLMASAGAHSNTNAFIMGYDAGAGVGIDFGSKWQVQVLASYGHYEQNGIMGSFRDKASYELSVPGNPGTSSGFEDIASEDLINNTVAYEVLRDLSDEFDYIHVPLIVQYKILPRLSVVVGSRFSKLLKANSRFGINNNSPSSVLDLSSSNNRDFLSEYNLVNKLEIAGIAGVSYAFTRHFSLQAMYLRSFTPQINKSGVSNRSDYLHSLRFGVTYQL